MKRLLEGKPFGHPLHPMLVHLPIGLFLLSFFFDVASLLGRGPYFGPAFYTMALGILTALLAAVPGIVDYTDIRADHPAKSTATWHAILNVAAVILYAVNLAVRWPQLEQGGRPTALPLIMSLVGVLLLGFSGYLGGALIYDDGIAVGRHRRKGKTPKETIQRSEADAHEGFVEVADEADLDDHQTLRAEVNGVVMTIVLLDGQVYAFQEFCTHRYGPLSEGAFKDGTQVICPWHGSCFDVRSGKVTHGPAKEDVRAFEVALRDGKVLVRVPQARAKV